MVLGAGVSFRAVGKLFVEINLHLELSLGTPTHTTVLNWTKKQGVGNFREKDYFNSGEWVLIIDESIQFGNKKLLLVVAVPSDFRFEKRAVGYHDLTPLIIKVSDSWKSEDIARELSSHIALDRISYAVSDNGNNLVKTFEQLKIRHMEDINHKFSCIMQKVFENNELFISYTKQLSGMRGKLSISRYARIVPPTQRIVSRYMNLYPVFSWGVKMLKLLETDRLTDEEKTILSFLHDYRDFIIETHKLIEILNSIQKLIKNNGFNKQNINMALQSLDFLNDNNAVKVKKLVKEYLFCTELKMGNFANILCSSDIIESCFGKYKELTKSNKTVGITDLSLCLSAMMCKNTEKIKNDFERIKTKDVKNWKNENISKTLFAEKMELSKFSA